MQMTFEKITFNHDCFDAPVIYEQMIRHLKNDCGTKFKCPFEQDLENNYNKR